MKVKELIEILSKLDGEQQVLVEDAGEPTHIVEVYRQGDKFKFDFDSNECPWVDEYIITTHKSR